MSRNDAEDTRASLAEGGTGRTGNERAPGMSRRQVAVALVAGIGITAVSGAEVQAATGRSIFWVDSIGTAAAPGALRGVTGSAGKSVVAQGFWSKGDGGGGLFCWSTPVEPDNGGTVIVPSMQTTGCWKRIWSGSLSVKWFGAYGDGDASSPHDDSAAIANTIAAGTAVAFPEGVYAHTQTLRFGKQGLVVLGQGRALLKHTGTGEAVTITDADPERNLYDVTLENLVIQGNAGTTDGLHVKGCHHLKLKRIRVFDVSEAALRVDFCVLASVDHFTCSVNETDFQTRPKYGIVLDQRGAGEYSVAMTFDTPVIEGVTGTGILINNASNCVFLGGTSEGNGRGVEVKQGYRNKFVGLWCEGNALSDIDISGRNTLLEGIYAGSLSVSDPNVRVFGQATVFQGGFLRFVYLQSGSQSTLFLGSQVSYHPSLGIQGSGSLKMVGVTKVDEDGGITGSVEDQ